MTTLNHLPRWQWALIGLALGALAGWTWTRLPASAPDPRATGITPALFALYLDRGLSTRPLDHLTIYPPHDGRSYLTGTSHALGQRDDGPLRHFQFNAPVPFRYPGQPTTPPPDYTIRDYLRDHHPDISYTYVWWDDPRTQLQLCSAAGLLLIGGLWPVTLSLASGTGLWGPKRAKLPKPTTTAATPPDPTLPPVDTAARLAELERAVDAQIAATTAALAGHAPSPAPATAAPPLPVPVLTGASLEPPPPSPQGDPKDYRGEYYPVARPISAAPDAS